MRIRISGAAPRRMCRLFCGWRTTFSDAPLTPTLDYVLEAQEGAPPVLHLYDADSNEAADPISISQWKAEHIFEFLQSKLS